MVIRRRRRRARRLRRFRRPYRRTGRSRRYRSRRSYGRRRRLYYGRRRRRFFQRRGYKVATTRWKIPGGLKRTYKFYVSKETLNTPAGVLGTTTGNSNWIPCFANIVNRQNVPANVDAWYGAGNIMSFENLTVAETRALGYDSYTLINLSFPGLFNLQYIGFYTNQTDLIVHDLQKYGYYKPISVSVKLIPRYPPLQAKQYGVIPTKIDPHGVFFEKGTEVAEVSGALAGTPTTTAWTVNSNVVAPLTSMNLTSDGAVYAFPSETGKFNVSEWSWKERFDTDAEELVGYIIPAASVGAQGTSVLTTWWENGQFGHMNSLLTTNFLSSFRKAPFARSYISTRKPTTFIARFPVASDCGVFQSVPTGIGVNNTTNPPTVYANFSQYDCQGYGPSPFTGLQSRSNGYIPAQVIQYLYQRTSTGTQGIGDDRNPVPVNVPQFMPYENFNVFIPGINATQLMYRYKLQFSYKVYYSGKSFDHL